MLYVSTRGNAQPVSSAEAIKQGLAPDGGLFVPNAQVKLTPDQLQVMRELNYPERAVMILKQFLTDFTEPELQDCVAQAYSPAKFSHPAITPIAKLNPSVYLLELWHGPTCAFKDLALQLLPHLLTLSLKKTGEAAEIAILVATSGDTGKAALEGFKDVAGTKIIVFYPDQGVSEVQKRQMLTQEGQNVSVVAVAGNFDDAQEGVKNIFGNQEFNQTLSQKQIKLSSANSINWGRLVPQIVYYISAYVDLIKAREIIPGEPINIVVPTGNFGNILAAFYAREMGLPFNRLICAANTNNVLTDFIRTGVYDRNRPFEKTISPSMDILVSSNLERLLFELSDRDSQRINTWMGQLKENGRYQIDSSLQQTIQARFWSDFATDAETLDTISETYAKYNYVLDTHTAVGKCVYDKYAAATDDKAKTLIASTASPFKFSNKVAEAIIGTEASQAQDEFAVLELLAKTGNLPIPKGLQGLAQKPVLHHLKTERMAMQDTVSQLLNPNSLE